MFDGINIFEDANQRIISIASRLLRVNRVAGYFPGEKNFERQLQSAVELQAKQFEHCPESVRCVCSQLSEHNVVRNYFPPSEVR